MSQENARPVASDALRSIARSRPTVARGSSSLREVAQMMVDEACSAVVVKDRDGGHHVITERDIVRAVSDGADPDKEWAVDVMSVDLRTLGPDHTIADAGALMRDAVIRHVVISDPDDPDAVAMVSIRDLLGPFLNTIES
ncbi:MAG: CBS domain-containing protein [Actinomycetota bacterium]